MEKIKIFLGRKQEVVEVEVVARRPRSILVRLEDGNVIVRKLSTRSLHVVNEDGPVNE